MRDKAMEFVKTCDTALKVGLHNLASWGGGSLASQTFARKTGRSVDISIAVAVPVERTECNFCCVINLNSCACRFINIALQ